MHRFTRTAGLCLAVATLALAGCSNTLRHNYMRDEASHHVYRKELVEIWPAVHAVLKERGLSWRENPGLFVLETEWRESGGGTLGPTTSSRFLVEGLRQANGGVSLRVTRLDRTSQSIGVGYTDGLVRNSRDRAAAANGSTASGTLPTENRSSRDLELELELLQRIDPEGAAKLEADAKAAHP
ncbi:hypothetical protein [Pyxidicoccus caerfyrddinensis]|uniref:hypothetical protein n=1 Tax=Pyxidicoccus caerfyrddinensis TaxID=2709663 RepID=UPI0013D922E9|nr:hypothetical protein [Pyxidicoccus caerfyrddinensis]